MTLPLLLGFSAEVSFLWLSPWEILSSNLVHPLLHPFSDTWLTLLSPSSSSLPCTTLHHSCYREHYDCLIVSVSPTFRHLRGRDVNIRMAVWSLAPRLTNKRQSDRWGRNRYTARVPQTESTSNKLIQLKQTGIDGEILEKKGSNVQTRRDTVSGTVECYARW